MDRKNHNYNLSERQFLLKVNENYEGIIPTGFLTKLNKDGSIPVAFADWPRAYKRFENKLPEIKVHTECLRKGWKIHGMRFGESQNWGVLVHPLGFTIEIHAQVGYSNNKEGLTLMDIIQNYTIIKGEIQGSFRWENNRLYTNE